MKNKAFTFIGLLATSALLAGCANGDIYEFTDQTACGNASIDVTNPTPVVWGTTDDEPLGLEVTLVEGVTLEYRFGIYNESGFTELNPALLGPNSVYANGTAMPTGPSFFDIYGPETGETPLSFQVDASKPTLAGLPLIELLDQTQTDVLESLNLAFAPGAFLLKCGDYYGDGVQIYPNFEVYSGSDYPTFSTADGVTFDFDLPAELADKVTLILGQKRVLDSSQSSDLITDRWLQLFTLADEGADFFTLSNPNSEAGGGGFVVGQYETFAPVAGDVYSLMMFSIDPATLQLGEDRVPEKIPQLQLSIFDLAIGPDGKSGLTRAFDGKTFVSKEEIAELVETGGRPTPPTYSKSPSLTDFRQSIAVSTKGYRNVELPGFGLSKITGVKSGLAQGRVLSAGESILSVRLPKQKPGVYDLTLSYFGGEIQKALFLNYYQSTKKTELSVPKDQKKSAWKLKLDAALGKNLQTVQVDCVARVPAGIKAAPLKKKASAICASVSDSSIKTRVVVKKVSSGASPAVTVKLWD